MNINYAKIDSKTILLRDVNNLLSAVQKSHLSNSDKHTLLYELTVLKQKIEKEEKNNEKVS